MTSLNETHDLKRRSWIESANSGDTDFPIQNLPYCFFSVGNGMPRAGVAIGTDIFDLAAATDLGLLPHEAGRLIRECTGKALNPLMAAPPELLQKLRARISEILSAGNDKGITHRSALIVAQQAVALHLPVQIGGFTDFFTSLYHTERGGRVFRPDNPVPRNFRYLPIAYNSRASSVRLSGEPIRRPKGQWEKKDHSIVHAPTEALDFELELGCFIGAGNPLGDPISINAASRHAFGYCLVNDWSARDVQRWESFPLGPFLAKTLSTTISPFIVTSEALAPFRTAAASRPAGDPKPLPYLFSESDQREGGIDLVMEAFIQTEAMRRRKEKGVRVTRTNFKDMYWTIAQMLTHHASNGCNFQTGDLIGSGTTSGPTDESRACLAEITVGGNPIQFLGGEQRTWLEDGDTVTFKAKAQRSGYVSIGFGECSGSILPAYS